MNSHLLNVGANQPTNWKECVNSMHSMGITWDRVGCNAWERFQRDSSDIDTFRYRWFDSLLNYYLEDSINILWYFWMSPPWAGSNPDTDTVSPYIWNVHWSFPVKLFEPVLVNGHINPNNYFGQYVYKFVKRYGPNGDFWQSQSVKNPIKYYEMWCEPEWGVRDGWWGNTSQIIDPYYDSLIVTLGDTTSLIDVYARLCIVGDSAARIAAAENGAADSIYTIVYLPYHYWEPDTGDPEYWPRSNVWLEELRERNVHNYCNGIAFHAYAWLGAGPDTQILFHNRQKLTLDSVWIFLKNSAGGVFSNKFLWATEHSTGLYYACDSLSYGFSVQTDEQLATLCSFYANYPPKGPLSNCFLWVFSRYYFNDNANDSTRLKCITRRSFEKRPPGYGFQQLTRLLKDCRFNQCLTTGTMYDTLKVYEFENEETRKKMYVGWKEWNRGAGARSFNLPMRTNAAKVDSVAHSANPGGELKTADTRGWVNVALDTAPIFVYEPPESVFRRPDLVIDSIWTNPVSPAVGDSVTCYALIRNIDTLQATTDTTFVKYYNNDTLFAIDTILAQIKPESTFVSSLSKKMIATKGLHLGKAVVNPDRKFVEHNFTNNAQYRLYNIPLRPYGSIRINSDQAYTDLPYVVLNLNSVNPNDSLNPPADSMKIWQYYTQQETLRYSTNWIPYDSAYCWYLLQGEGNNIVYIQYKVGGFSESPVYCDTIIFDQTAPGGSFVINNDSAFTNSPNVVLNNSMSDTRSGMAKMRFGNRYLKNLVKNSAYDDTSFWEMDTAIYHDSLKLFEIPVQTAGNYFYQSIPPESLSAFDNDTMLLWIDLVSDGFVGNGKVQFQYIYGIPTDSIDPRGTHPFGTSISIPQGTLSHVSHYNLYSSFKYHPEPPQGKVLLEARVGVFVDAGAQNSGRLFIDNLRLDVVGPYNDYSKFENYDSLKSWVLTSGNGIRKVYSQFSDGGGNETEILSDSIIVDTTRPARHISSPQNGQTISGTVTITGWAYDYADPQQHFKLYELKYMKNTDPEQHWYGIHPESLFYTPKNPAIPPQTLGRWDTREVTNNHGNGWYYLKLAVEDSANNYRDTTISVFIDNPLSPGGEISGFGNYLYGLSAGTDIYIGEFGTGNIYRYDNNYQLLGTFQIIDSLGIGFPVAMRIDNSGKIWIANIVSQTMNRFSAQGNFEFRFGGNLSLPSGIAFDNAGNIWVSDRLHHKIKKFDSSGNLLFEFGTKGSGYGEIDRPIGIGINGEKVYIADSRNARISIFDTTGNFIGVIGDSAGLLLPFGLVLDSTGCLFVSDFLGNRVLEFDPYGGQLLEIDSILDAPSGLALSDNEKTLYVSDTKHKRVLAFVVRDEPPDSTGGGPMGGESQISRRFYLEKIYPNPFKDRLVIKFQGVTSSQYPVASIRIYDISGRVVKSFSLTTDYCVLGTIVWDGKDDLGRRLPSGVYFVRLEINGFKKIEKVILLR